MGFPFVGNGYQGNKGPITLMGRTSSARQRLLSAASDLLWEKS